MPCTTFTATISHSGSPIAYTKNRAACAAMPMAIVVRQPRRASTAPSVPIVTISATCPMLIAGMIQLADSPARSRNGLVHWK